MEQNYINFPELQELLFKSGKVNMAIKNVTKVCGKVGDRHTPSRSAI